MQSRPWLLAGAAVRPHRAPLKPMPVAWRRCDGGGMVWDDGVGMVQTSPLARGCSTPSHPPTHPPTHRHLVRLFRQVELAVAVVHLEVISSTQRNEQCLYEWLSRPPNPTPEQRGGDRRERVDETRRNRLVCAACRHRSYCRN